MHNNQPRRTAEILTRLNGREQSGKEQGVHEINEEHIQHHIEQRIELVDQSIHLRHLSFFFYSTYNCIGLEFL